MQIALSKNAVEFASQTSIINCTFSFHYKSTPIRQSSPFDKGCGCRIVMNISDKQTEYQINDRLSFMRFLGLGIKDKVPDAKTIWLFKERLIEGKVSEKLFGRFGREKSETKSDRKRRDNHRCDDSRSTDTT